MASRIEVHDLVTFVEHVEHQKGKYIKIVLKRLERSGALTPEIRKHILDGFGSYARSIYHAWYDVED